MHIDKPKKQVGKKKETSEGGDRDNRLEEKQVGKEADNEGIETY